MPKKRKPDRTPAATLRVVSMQNETPPPDLRRMGSLLVVQGAEVDLGQHMLCDHPIIIGRDERVDFSLSDGSISRAHCSVERAEDQTGYVLIDLDSTNGTTLNGKQVKGRIALETGDKIFLGSSVLRFAFSDQVDVQYHSRVEELVQTDALTGLDTKRQYDAVFDVVAKQAAREGSQIAVAVMDLDGLKAINDTHGHEMGSFAIREVATLIQECMENYGHLARFGGDEFVCCFPSIDHEVAVELAEELRAAVESHDFSCDGIRVHPTICVGVASYPEHVENPAALFKAADDALYRAKRSGKNRVESAVMGAER
tara:strand:- start:39783 stop:40721 length:939 start_codon:yes stop_codon:yes gene_type:complete